MDNSSLMNSGFCGVWLGKSGSQLSPGIDQEAKSLCSGTILGIVNGELLVDSDERFKTAMQDHDDRLTKRRITDNPVIGTDHKFPPGTPDSVLIADELESIKLLAEEANGDLDVPWGNSLKLDEDDWILRQIFRKSGLNPKRAGHWRLLLGILAEFQVDPNEYDDFKRGHVADDISSTRWKPDEREELLGQASALAIKHPEMGPCEDSRRVEEGPKMGSNRASLEGPAQ
ncbi:hypothetical protein ACVWZW_008397 [Bradyrhizobium sp. F1.13.4]